MPTVNTASRDSFPTAAPVAAPHGGGDDGEVDPAGAALDSDENNLDYEFADDDAAADAGTVAWLLCPYLLLALAGVIFIHLRMRRRRRAGGMGLDGAFRFQRDGVVERSFEVREIRDGEVVIVDAAPTRFED